MDNAEIIIAGAGPAGLAAAITLAHTGRRVVVHEAQTEVGCRFKRDLQEIKNWTTRKDALAVLAELAITTDFDHLACREGAAFDAWGRARTIRSDQPLFYVVERVPGPGTGAGPGQCPDRRQPIPARPGPRRGRRQA